MSVFAQSRLAIAALDICVVFTVASMPCHSRQGLLLALKEKVNCCEPDKQAGEDKRAYPCAYGGMAVRGHLNNASITWRNS